MADRRRIGWVDDGESACRRDSVVDLSQRVAIHLSGPPGDVGRAGRPTFDLAPGGVYIAARVTPGAGALLPHRCTLACNGPSPDCPSAVCFLLHFPSSHLDWPLASTLPCGVPTFLDRVERPAATTRPTHRQGKSSGRRVSQPTARTSPTVHSVSDFLASDRGFIQSGTGRVRPGRTTPSQLPAGESRRVTRPPSAASSPVR